MANYFLPLRSLLNTIISLDVDSLALEIARQPTLQKLVIELNTKDQLYTKGEDSFNRKLKGKTIVRDGQYSPLTVKIKKAKGQPTNRVTLHDTGEFYASFVVRPYRGGFVIDADPFKKGVPGGPENTDLFEEFGDSIVGLNQQNLLIVIEYFKNEILEKINSKLRAA